MERGVDDSHIVAVVPGHAALGGEAGLGLGTVKGLAVALSHGHITDHKTKGNVPCGETTAGRLEGDEVLG